MCVRGQRSGVPPGREGQEMARSGGCHHRLPSDIPLGLAASDTDFLSVRGTGVPPVQWASADSRRVWSNPPLFDPLPHYYPSPPIASGLLSCVFKSCVSRAAGRTTPAASPQG